MRRPAPCEEGLNRQPWHAGTAASGSLNERRIYLEGEGQESGAADLSTVTAIGPAELAAKRAAYIATHTDQCVRENARFATVLRAGEQDAFDIEGRQPAQILGDDLRRNIIDVLAPVEHNRALRSLAKARRNTSS